MIKNIGKDSIKEIKDLYRCSGWITYLQDNEKLIRTIENSILFGYFKDGKLLGFVRIITDGEHILYIQDLIVKNNFRRNGIGRKLISYIENEYSDVRTLALMTDKMDEVANNFYKNSSLKSYETIGVTGYAKFR